MRLPGVPEGEHEDSYSRDVFAKAQSCAGSRTVPEVSKWTNRELEIVGFNDMSRNWPVGPPRHL